MSILLTRKDVELVIKTLDPAIRSFLLTTAKRPALAIRVLDPASPDKPVVLYEEDFGTPHEWEYDFGSIALRKAIMCQREKCDSEVVINERPHCLREDDPPYAGGVYVQGLAIGCSGVEGYFDQMFARWIAAGCRAVATHRFETVIVAGNLSAIPATI